MQTARWQTQHLHPHLCVNCIPHHFPYKTQRLLIATSHQYSPSNTLQPCTISSLSRFSLFSCSQPAPWLSGTRAKALVLANRAVKSTGSMLKSPPPELSPKVALLSSGITTTMSSNVLVLRFAATFSSPTA